MADEYFKQIAGPSIRLTDALHKLAMEKASRILATQD